MSRSTRLIGVLLALAWATTGCQDTGTDAGAAVPAPLSAAPDQLTPSINYVALGDSFTAGPFISTMRADPQGCARSRSNYPAFLADWLDVATYTDVSCSGALTTDLYAPQQLFDGDKARPQLDALNADTDLVTLGLGGNDFGIYEGLIGCQGSQSSFCPVAQLDADARKVQTRIARAVRRIERRAPDADIYVVGYPDILPTEGTCAAVGVSAETLAPVTSIAAALNTSLRRGAKQSGAIYVDLEAISRGHDVCAKGRAWVNGPRFRAGVAAPFHPKINGMRAVASTLYEQITGLEPEVSEYANPDPAAVVLNRS